MARYREVETFNGVTYGFCNRRKLRIELRFGLTSARLPNISALNWTRWSAARQIGFERHYKWFAIQVWLITEEVEEVIHG